MRGISFFFITLSFLFLASFSSSIHAEEPSPALISVSGDAEVKVAPDRVILTLGVESWDKDLSTAKVDNDLKVSAITSLSKKYNIEKKHVKTDHISIEPRYEDQWEHRKFVGYFVRKTVVFTLHDIELFDDLLSSALENGANYVHGVQFLTSNLREHRDRARALAIKAAKEKAGDLAKELDLKIGKPRTINENPSNWWSAYNSYWGSSWRGGAMYQNVVQTADSSAMTGANIEPGMISVTARVSVTFELQ